MRQKAKFFLKLKSDYIFLSTMRQKAKSFLKLKLDFIFVYFFQYLVGTKYQTLREL